MPVNMEGSSRVYWLTGLSGAGKSTLCRLLTDRLRSLGHAVVMLDGDEIREVMHAENVHSREDRLDLAMRYAKLCRMIASQGIDVAIATISMFKEVHAWNRQNIPGYIEIYLHVPLDELKRRDPKRIYERASRGEITNVAGVDLQVDEPADPHIRINHHEGKTAEAAFQELWQQITIANH